MSRMMRVFLIILAAEGLLFFYNWASAMGASASKQANNAPRATSNQMVFTGVVQAMNGSQWTINDQVYAVDPSVIQYGTLAVGSPVKVQANVAQDGSITITSLGPPNSTMLGFNTAAGSTANGSQPSVNGIMPMTTPKSSDKNEQYENEITGTITAMSTSGITVNGKVYTLTTNSEIKSGLMVGDNVKLEFYAMPDGTFTVEEVRSAQSMNGNYNDNGNYNGSRSNGYNSNSNNNCSDDDQGDDHGSNSNSNSSGSCHESDDDD